ncbi:MAG: hypothetical protein ACXWD7_03885 [Solirubrobacterales bacterium]
MILAHIAGFPLEELLPLAPGAGAFWLALRASVHGRGTSPRRELP